MQFFTGMLGPGGVKAEIKLDGGSGTPLWWATKAACGRTPRNGHMQLTTQETEFQETAKKEKEFEELCDKFAEMGEHVPTFLMTALNSIKGIEKLQNHGAVELATLLVQKGADVKAVGTDRAGNETTPLWWAAHAVYGGRAGAAELATLLVEKGANVTAVGTDEVCGESTPLWWAAWAVQRGRAGGLELATLLVEKGADIDAIGSDESGFQSTPLWWAAVAVEKGEAGGLELAKLLVEQGADVSAVGTDGGGNQSTPLWWAAKAVQQGVCFWGGGLELAELLVAKGADVKAAGSDGAKNDCTPLWWAARAVQQGKKEGGLELAELLVEKLVEQGGDVNAVGRYYGRSGTPLRLAAEAVRDGEADGPQLARVLISVGAKLADDERHLQPHVEQDLRALAKRCKSRVCFIGVSGTVGTRQQAPSAARAEHLTGVVDDAGMVLSHYPNRSAWNQY
jgi:hypothetical protein